MDEREIQWAIDELKIRNIVTQMAFLSDLGDINDWGNLFADDAVYMIKGVPAPRADIYGSNASETRKPII